MTSAHLQARFSQLPVDLDSWTPKKDRPTAQGQTYELMRNVAHDAIERSLRLERCVAVLAEMVYASVQFQDGDWWHNGERISIERAEYLLSFASLIEEAQAAAPDVAAIG